MRGKGSDSLAPCPQCQASQAGARGMMSWLEGLLLRPPHHNGAGMFSGFSIFLAASIRTNEVTRASTVIKLVIQLAMSLNVDISLILAVYQVKKNKNKKTNLKIKQRILKTESRVMLYIKMNILEADALNCLIKILFLCVFFQEICSVRDAYVPNASSE